MKRDISFFRGFSKTLVLSAFALMTSLIQAQVTTSMSDTVPLYFPETEFVLEAVVDIAPGMDLGDGPYGPRGMVPITGGTFAGPGIQGVVLPGGADRQLTRPDGMRMLDALYELQTDDGAIITIHNEVLSPTGQTTRFSQITLLAPEEYGWLNGSIYVGTLNSLRPARDAVLVRVFRVK